MLNGPGSLLGDDRTVDVETTMQNADRLRIVAMGGGTGMKALLSGLHKYDVDVTAIITVADDGGSSGRLRRDFDIPPPGDIRNCLVALSDADPLIGELFQYRFEESILKGHSFGNLFIAVLTKLSGDFRTAIERARSLLSVRGQVLPSTDRKVVLTAEHPDGTKSTGEQAISASRKSIVRMSLVPKPPPVSEEIEKVLEAADVVCFGPGSLYTSITPNLLVPGMVDAVNRSNARTLYIANLMTQPGETDGCSLEMHVRSLLGLSGGLRIDEIVSRSEGLDAERAGTYLREGAQPVDDDLSIDAILGVPIRRLPLIDAGSHIRHSPALLSAIVVEAARRRRAAAGGRS